MTTEGYAHHFTAGEIADLLQQPAPLIDRMVRCKRCPPWIWKPHWREPRFPESSIPHWLRILDNVDVDTLPLNPPPLERPAEIFGEHP